MNWFKFPKYIYKNIDKVNRNFFWNINYEDITTDKHKLHTIVEDINAVFIAN